MEMTRCLGHDWFPARGPTRLVGCSMQEVDVWLAGHPCGPGFVGANRPEK